jgi:acetate---CoA ligase (ADP-forming)
MGRGLLPLLTLIDDEPGPLARGVTGMSPPRHRQADVVLRDGSTVHVRPVRATDALAVRAFFERLSPRSIALRFFCGFPDLDRAVRWATEVDQHRYGLIATSSADGRVVTHAGWEREPDRPERAEIAFAIADAMQHNGLGTILLSQLTQAAEQAGIAVLTAEVLPQNHRMLHVFRDSGFAVTTRTIPGVVLVELPTSLSPRAGALRTPRAALEQAPFGEDI